MPLGLEMLYDNPVSSLVAGLLLLVLGLRHVFAPDGSFVAELLVMVFDVLNLGSLNITNSLTNILGLFIRAVGIGVAAIGWGQIRG